jgi:hypothetical protein
MKITNKYKKVGDPDGSDGSTYRLAVSNECFATSNKVVRPTIDERALASRGAK